MWPLDFIGIRPSDFPKDAAYVEGGRDYNNGCIYNPYDYGTAEYDSWEEGWTDSFLVDPS